MITPKIYTAIYMEKTHADIRAPAISNDECIIYLTILHVSSSCSQKNTKNETE